MWTASRVPEGQISVRVVCQFRSCLVSEGQGFVSRTFWGFRQQAETSVQVDGVPWQDYTPIVSC